MKNPFRIAMTTSALFAAAAAVCFAFGQPDGDRPPPTTDQPPGERHSDRGEGRRQRQPMTREEMRTRFRQFLDQRADQLRREQDEIERAIKMFDEGKTVDEIRAEFPDRRTGGGAGGNRRGDWLSRFDGDWGMGDDRPMGRPDGDGRPDQGPPGERDPNQPLTSEEKETIRDFIRSTAPQLLASLDELEKRDSELAERKYRDMLRKTRFLIELRKRDRALYDLRLTDIRTGREAIEAARAIARMDKDGASTADSAREGQVVALKKALDEQFTTRAAIKRHDFQRNQERMANDEKDLAAREARREQIIGDSMTKMIESERRRLDNPKRGDGDDPMSEDRPPRRGQGSGGGGPDDRPPGGHEGRPGRGG